jgi:hypothetical protein
LGPSTVAPGAVGGGVDDIKAFLTGPPPETAESADQLVGQCRSSLVERFELEPVVPPDNQNIEVGDGS